MDGGKHEYTASHIIHNKTSHNTTCTVKPVDVNINNLSAVNINHPPAVNINNLPAVNMKQTKQL